MSKTVKWILFGLLGLVVLFVIVKMVTGNKDTGEKVTAEKVTRRTIIETVNASGKVYPEVEVKISPDISQLRTISSNATRGSGMHYAYPRSIGGLALH